MAHNKLYRNFIILQEDEKTHADSGEKALSGYAKIEAKSDKCKISFYAQNLKREDDYSIVLICYKKDIKQIVDLGSFNVREEGKGEVSKEYYVNNIAGLNFSYDKISGAAVCKNKDAKLLFLMYGFMNGENIDDEWKKCKIVNHNDKNEDNESLKKKLEVYELPKKIKNVECKKEKVEVVEGFLDEDTEAICEGDKASIIGKGADKFGDNEFTQEAIKENSKASMLSEEEMIKMHHNHEEKQSHGKDKSHQQYKNCCHKERNDDHDCVYESNDIKNDINIYESRSNNEKIDEENEIDPYDFELSGIMGAFFSDITRGFEECRNKYKDIQYCKWYKVKVNSLDDMCDISNYNKYTLAYYPMLNYYPYIKKHKHFIVGYKCDKKGNLKYIVYGVPGTKSKKDQPYGGKTGFVTWMDAKEQDLGYWLMFYDYKKSAVAYPSK